MHQLLPVKVVWNVIHCEHQGDQNDAGFFYTLVNKLKSTTH